MARFRTGYNRLEFKVGSREYEVGGGISLTVPGQAMSIRELYDRSSRVDELLYRDDQGEVLDQLPADWESMDTFEKLDYVRDAGRRVLAMQTQLAKQKEEEDKKKVIEEYEARKAAAPPAAESVKPE